MHDCRKGIEEIRIIQTTKRIGLTRRIRKPQAKKQANNLQKRANAMKAAGGRLRKK